MRTAEELERKIDHLLQASTLERALELGGEEFGTSVLVYVNALRWALNSDYLPNHLKQDPQAAFRFNFSRDLVGFLMSQLGEQ